MTLSKSPEEFQGFVEEESKRWARIIKENNISLD
jgi:tripartite-type tricarboxylate transporter receptor subunit TctC